VTTLAAGYLRPGCSKMIPPGKTGCEQGVTWVCASEKGKRARQGVVTLGHFQACVGVKFFTKTLGERSHMNSAKERLLWI
jgi:hypothetical protein